MNWNYYGVTAGYLIMSMLKENEHSLYHRESIWVYYGVTRKEIKN